MTARSGRGRRALGLALAGLAAALVTGCAVGAVAVPPGAVVRILLGRLPGAAAWAAPVDPNWTLIIWDIRLPRVLLGALTGAALALAGAAFQGLFQNPMADPSVVGASAGAALGAAAALAALLRWGWGSLAAVPGAAFLGGLAAVATAYRLAVVGRRLPVVNLLLAGVTVSSTAAALISLILLLNQERMGPMVVWLLGGLGGATWQRVGIVLPYLAAGTAAIWACTRELNALLLGEERAIQLGADVEQVKRVILAAGAVLTAGAVAFAGNIGFVGLMVPHLARLLVGPDHRWLLPVSGVMGAAVLVLADTAARSLFGVREVPVGIVMALTGGPFFLYLLRKHSQGVPAP